MATRLGIGLSGTDDKRNSYDWRFKALLQLSTRSVIPTKKQMYGDDPVSTNSTVLAIDCHE